VRERCGVQRRRVGTAQASPRARRHRINYLEQGLRRVAKAADSYVHEHTLSSIAIAAGVSFLIGVLYRRRD
jgi:ElaB/YqjD/DUF883 family membrane-anchored ribosome-binding protein